MASPALVPGSSSWRTRFLVHRRKSEPLLLRIHDSLHGIDYFFRFRTHDEVQHHVNQLRAGYTNLAPDGVFAPPEPLARS